MGENQRLLEEWSLEAIEDGREQSHQICCKVLWFASLYLSYSFHEKYSGRMSYKPMKSFHFEGPRTFERARRILELGLAIKFSILQFLILHQNYLEVLHS